MDTKRIFRAGTIGRHLSPPPWLNQWQYHGESFTRGAPHWGFTTVNFKPDPWPGTFHRKSRLFKASHTGLGATVLHLTHKAKPRPSLPTHMSSMWVHLLNMLITFPCAYCTYPSLMSYRYIVLKFAFDRLSTHSQHYLSFKYMQWSRYQPRQVPVWHRS